jgi:hypothetical protein
MIHSFGKKNYRALSSHPLYIAFSRGLTFSWFAFSLIWFWSNWPQAQKMFLEVGVRDSIAAWLIIWTAATVVLAGWEALRTSALSVQIQGNPVLQSRYWRTAWATGLLVIALGVVMLSNRPAPEMVYKTF